MIEYYYQKLLQAICMSKNPEQYFDKKVLSIQFLNVLKIFLVNCNQNSIMNENMKDNLLRLVNYIRFNGYPELANDFILLINTSKISYYFWQSILEEEFEDRKMYKNEYLNFLDDEQIEELFYSLELDYKVLKSLVCNEDKFDNYYINELMLDEFYFSSLKKIYLEHPEILDNQQSWIRICTINLVNEQSKNEIPANQKQGHKKLIKTGRKLIKTVIK